MPDHIRSDNGKLRDELLEREAFDTLLEAKVLIERWRQNYNTIRPHSAYAGKAGKGSEYLEESVARWISSVLGCQRLIVFSIT